LYRARDSRLNRDVAIKVLPAALADDAQYIARFEREAQMLAALNHFVQHSMTRGSVKSPAPVAHSPVRVQDLVMIPRQDAG
jgi:serine/threonine protein kinase